jgi:hypothetical protein
MSRELMQQAFDAIKLHLLHHEHGCVYLNPVMYAIEAELAKPEHANPAAKHWHDLYYAKCKDFQDQQARLGAEIVALEEEIAELKEDQPEQQFYPDWDMLKPFHERIAELEAELAKHEQEPRKEWVSLSDDEVDACFEDHGWSSSAMYHMVVHAIEAKLKEKNGL